MLRKNDVLDVEVIDMNYLGLGVAKHEGSTVVIGGAVTGDKLTVKIIKAVSGYFVARIEKILIASPYRAEPDCPDFKRCGGCAYQHISFEYEQEQKRRRVENELARFGFKNVKVHTPVAANESGYRNKLQCPVSENGEIGFYAPRTHDIIPIKECSLQEELTRPVFEYLKEYIKRSPIKGLRHLYVRCGKGTGEVMVCFICANDSFKGEKELAREITEKFPEVKSVIINVNKKDTNVILGEKCRIIVGNEAINDILCGIKFKIHPLAFYQVNHDCTELLYREAARLADVKPCETLVDLYCGAGTVGLCINSITPAKKLIGVEIVPEAVENARYNAKENGVENAEFYCCAAEDMNFGCADVVVVDPPRKGCAASLIEYIGKMKPSRVVYISCSPDTLARDCAELVKHGYTFNEARPFNMFPRTGHVETVVLLTREKSEHKMNLCAEPFEMIKSGQKTIELRLNDEKRQKLKVGDEITFTNNVNGESLKRVVLKLHHFNSFVELYQALPLLKCGYTEQNVDTAKASDMDAYYSVNEQAKYGVVGIELCQPFDKK